MVSSQRDILLLGLLVGGAQTPGEAASQQTSIPHTISLPLYRVPGDPLPWSHIWNYLQIQLRASTELKLPKTTKQQGMRTQGLLVLRCHVIHHQE